MSLRNLDNYELDYRELTEMLAVGYASAYADDQDLPRVPVRSIEGAVNQLKIHFKDYRVERTDVTVDQADVIVWSVEGIIQFRVMLLQYPSICYRSFQSLSAAELVMTPRQPSHSMTEAGAKRLLDCLVDDDSIHLCQLGHFQVRDLVNKVYEAMLAAYEEKGS